MSKPRYPSPYIAITDMGIREITFYWLPEELNSDEIFEIADEWVRQELVSRGMDCDFRYMKHDDMADYMEFSCSTRRNRKGKFYEEEVREWGKPEFIEKLHNLFQRAMSKAVKTKQETGKIDS